MSGGIAYVYDPDGVFPSRCNCQMVGLDTVDDEEEAAKLRGMIEEHYKYTGSGCASGILADWNEARGKFVKVIPHDYKRAVMAMKEVAASGMTGEDAVMAAFEKNINDPARVSGN